MDAASAQALMNAGERDLIACSDEEWRNLISYSLRELEAYFGGKVAAEPIESASIGRGFCLDVSGATKSLNAPIQWKGILGATIVDGELHVSLTVFFYSGDRRLFASIGEAGEDGRGGREFAEYEFESTTKSGCCWKLVDWFDDVYGEYESF